MTLCKVILFVCLTVTTTSIANSFVDGVVATVGREPILHSDVMQEMIPMLQAINAEALTPEEQELRFKELFEEALEQVIEYYILYSEAVNFEIEIPYEDVEKQITEARSQYESTDAFQKALEESGHTISDFRERLRRQMMAVSVSRSKRMQFRNEVVVSKSDIAQFYQDHLDDFHYPARYRVRRIFVQADSDPVERKNAIRELEKLRVSLLTGEDFANAAKIYSNGPEAEEGGMLGWVLAGDLVEPLNSALEAMIVDEISVVLETEYGLHLLKLEGRETEGASSLEEVRNQIEPLLREQHGEKHYRQWMNSLRRRNNVRVLI
ncbi:MAG: peptidylprolyl isomerase [Candidatus Hydrogenedentes bacterium]|nr:peptidylprolyl isomerase [Candidatus Hydrogenedentota bacterium]